MCANKRTPLQRDRDRELVAELKLKGLTLRQIAARIASDPQRGYTLSLSMISRDLASVRRMWQENAVSQYAEMKARELAKIDAVEREAWKSWDRSLEPRERTKAGRRQSRRSEDAGGPLPRRENPSGVLQMDSVEVWKEQRAGDPRYLDLVANCIDRRCHLFGLDEPIRVRLGNLVDRIPWDALTTEQRRRLADGERPEDVIPGMLAD